MVIKPRLKGSLALTNHPLGAKEFVKRQIDYIKSQDKYTGPKKVLIIGSSSGYGLASRVSLVFGAVGGIPLPSMKQQKKKGLFLKILWEMLFQTK